MVHALNNIGYTRTTENNDDNIKISKTNLTQLMNTLSTNIIQQNKNGYKTCIQPWDVYKIANPELKKKMHPCLQTRHEYR